MLIKIFLILKKSFVGKVKNCVLFGEMNVMIFVEFFDLVKFKFMLIGVVKRRY